MLNYGEPCFFLSIHTVLQFNTAIDIVTILDKIWKIQKLLKN